MKTTDVVIIGAGAAGLMCAFTAGRLGRKVILIEHTEKPGKKILISGGGRCNFTNIYAAPENFLSDNPDFCRSALAKYTPQDFIQLVSEHGIKFHEKKLGQLFCDGSSKQIVEMLLKECRDSNVKINCGEKVVSVTKQDRFEISTSSGQYSASSLIIATGGISIPKIGATGFGYEIAKQFGLRLTQIKPGLVPLILPAKVRSQFSNISGVSADTIVSVNNTAFRENTLITHKGLSGPAILQASSYWDKGDQISINFLPDKDFSLFLEQNRARKITLLNFLAGVLPHSLISVIIPEQMLTKSINHVSNVEIRNLISTLCEHKFRPTETEGFDKAEVTCGGVDTKELSSKTMESTKVKGLYFIGEAVDVTGWLGGYNFQWAWASGVAAGKNC